MACPKFIKDHTWQWLIGTIIAILAIIVPLLLSAPKPPTQSVESKGDNNVIVQVDRSPGASVHMTGNAENHSQEDEDIFKVSIVSMMRFRFLGPLLYFYNSKYGKTISPVSIALFVEVSNNKELISKIESIEQKAKRPKNVGLDISKLKRYIGSELKIYNLDEGLKYMKDHRS